MWDIAHRTCLQRGEVNPFGFAKIWKQTERQRQEQIEGGLEGRRVAPSVTHKLSGPNTHTTDSIVNMYTSEYAVRI